MVNPSKEADPQSDCPLFKLAAETRNQIYELVYATKTSEDGAVELHKTTAPPPSKAPTMACKQTYNKAHAMYKAAYRRYPQHDFTLHVSDRRQRPFIPTFSNKLFSRINTVRVTWRADEYNKGKPLRLTTHFTGVEGPQRWRIRVEMHDDYCKGEKTALGVVRDLEFMRSRAVCDTQPCVRASGKEMLSMTFSFAVHNVVYPLELEWAIFEGII